MKEKLLGPADIEIRSSNVDGYGVFATKDIPKGEILEECYYVLMAAKWMEVDTVLKKYVFSHKQHLVPQQDYRSVSVLGYGMIYNHSKSNNVSYIRDHENKIFTFVAKVDVRKDEELFIDYGDYSYAEFLIPNE